MVQLPIHLHPLDALHVRGFMDGLKAPAPVNAQIDLLSQVVLPNPRKVKRVINILSFTLAVVAAEPGLANVDPGTVARLVVAPGAGGRALRRGRAPA